MHFEYDPNRDKFRGTPAGGGFSQKLKDIQAFLIGRGYNLGPTGADGLPGAFTTAAIKSYQQYLFDRGWYPGPMDGQWGTNTEKAHQKFVAELTAGTGGTPPFPLPVSQWFGPEQGGPNSVSGWHGNREGLRMWQAKMIERGWNFGPDGADGLYGPKGSSSTDTYTGNNAKAFQKEKGLVVDGLIGPETWRLAWEAPVTPPGGGTTTPPVTPPEGSVLDPAAPWKKQTPDSALATWIGSPNYNNGSAPAREKKDWIVLHWFGSQADLAGNDSHFQQPGTIKNGRGTNASSQYAIGADGAVHQYVLEKDYAHTNGHTEANARSITIEHEGGPSKPITEATIQKSIELVADIAKRNGIAKLVWMENIFPHNKFVATQCPGTLDTARIVAGANALLNPVTPDPDPQPETVTVPKAELQKAWEYANETAALLGKLLSGE